MGHKTTAFRACVSLTLVLLVFVEVSSCWDKLRTNIPPIAAPAKWSGDRNLKEADGTTEVAPPEQEQVAEPAATEKEEATQVAEPQTEQTAEPAAASPAPAPSTPPQTAQLDEGDTGSGSPEQAPAPLVPKPQPNPMVTEAAKEAAVASTQNPESITGQPFTNVATARKEAEQGGMVHEMTSAGGEEWMFYVPKLVKNMLLTGHAEAPPVPPALPGGPPNDELSVFLRCNIDINVGSKTNNPAALQPGWWDQMQPRFREFFDVCAAPHSFNTFHAKGGSTAMVVNLHTHYPPQLVMRNSDTVPYVFVEIPQGEVQNLPGNRFHGIVKCRQVPGIMEELMKLKWCSAVDRMGKTLSYDKGDDADSDFSSFSFK